MHSPQRNGFTLVELLVVVSIIVILIAILLPAVEGAVYQAQLASCATRVRAVATNVISYATQNLASYPYRPSLAMNDAGWRRPNNINDSKYDDRTLLFQVVQPELLVDPLSGLINVEEPPAHSQVFSNYALWFGMQYPGEDGSLLRLNERLTWQGNQFSVLASDEDSILSDLANPGTHSSHNDSERRQQFVQFQEHTPGGFVMSRYQGTATHMRGPVDTNYAFTDGSVLRYNGVKWDDNQMARVPQGIGPDMSVYPIRWTHLPRR